MIGSCGLITIVMKSTDLRRRFSAMQITKLVWQLRIQPWDTAKQNSQSLKSLPVNVATVITYTTFFFWFVLRAVCVKLISFPPQWAVLIDENNASVWSRRCHLTVSVQQQSVNVSPLLTETHLAKLKMLRLESLLDNIVFPGSTRLSTCGGGRRSRCQAVQHLSNVKLLHFPPVQTRRLKKQIKRATINWIEGG